VFQLFCLKTLPIFRLSPPSLHDALPIFSCMPEITHILNALAQGDPHAANQLLPLVYDALRRLAARELAREAPGQTLDATALVHEDRKSTRLNSSHEWISYAVFCLKKKNN